MKIIMSIAEWNILGLTLVLFGVLSLFIFGMPFRIRSGGVSHNATEQVDPQQQKMDRVVGALGWLGLIMVMAGTLCQITANVMVF
jgi:hypothetical protein